MAGRLREVSSCLRICVNWIVNGYCERSFALQSGSLVLIALDSRKCVEAAFEIGDRYRFFVFRRALMRVLIDETANAPLASPARTSVGFSGESPQSVPPPNWARAGMERHRAKEKGSPTYSSSFFINSGPLTFLNEFSLVSWKSTKGCSQSIQGPQTRKSGSTPYGEK